MPRSAIHACPGEAAILVVTLRTVSWPMPRPGNAASVLIGKLPMMAMSSSLPRMPRGRPVVVGADRLAEQRGAGGVGEPFLQGGHPVQP